MAFDIDAALRYMVEREGSDLHLKVGSPPVARVHGDLWALEGRRVADARGHRGRARAHRRGTAMDTMKEFAEDGEADFAYQIRGVSRFRVNAFRQRGHGLDRDARDPLQRPDDRRAGPARRWSAGSPRSSAGSSC